MLASIFSFLHNVFYHSKTNFNCTVTIILSFAYAFNLDQSKILSFGKELNIYQTVHGINSPEDKRMNTFYLHLLLFLQYFLSNQRPIQIFQYHSICCLRLSVFNFVESTISLFYKELLTIWKKGCRKQCEKYENMSSTWSKEY